MSTWSVFIATHQPFLCTHIPHCWWFYLSGPSHILLLFVGFSFVCFLVCVFCFLTNRGLVPLVPWIRCFWLKRFCIKGGKYIDWISFNVLIDYVPLRSTPSARACASLSMKWCLMSSDVSWHIRDKLWPMPKHGSIILYVHGNQKARYGGQPRTATSTLTDTAPKLCVSRCRSLFCFCFWFFYVVVIIIIFIFFSLPFWTRHAHWSYFLSRWRL